MSDGQALGTQGWISQMRSLPSRSPKAVPALKEPQGDPKKAARKKQQQKRRMTPPWLSTQKYGHAAPPGITEQRGAPPATAQVPTLFEA